MFRRILGSLLLASTVASAATPSVTGNEFGSSFAGEQFCVDLSFSNTGGPGFGPYYRLVLPSDISLNSVTMFGSAVSLNNNGTFPSNPDNQLTDPLTEQSVTGDAGTSYYNLILPVGSVVTSGPALTTSVCATIDSGAVIGTPLDVTVEPVYRYGDTATGDNGPIVGTKQTYQVTPSLIRYEIDANVAENERALGRSYAFEVEDNVDVANTYSVTNIAAQIELDSDASYIGNSATTTGGVNGQVLLQPNDGETGSVNSQIDTITGSGSTIDATTDYDTFYDDILSKDQCSAQTTRFTGSLNADYLSVALAESSDFIEIAAKHVALQQSVNNSSAEPGDTIRITNAIQVTEFNDISNVVLVNTIADGLTFNNNVIIAGVSDTNITPSRVVEGNSTETITFDIGALNPSISAGTVITVSYDVIVEQTYDATGGFVLAADPLNNNAQINYDIVTGATSCYDQSASSVNIIPVSNSLTIVNPSPEYMPGEQVTYRHELTIPSGDTNDIVFETFLPLPVFDVSNLSTTFGTDIVFSPTNTVTIPTPTVTVDVPTNSVRIEWGNVSTTTTQTLAIDLAATVVEEPFADQLFLTTIFQASTNNTDPLLAIDMSPAQIQVRAPELEITAGVSASNNPLADAMLVASSPIDSNITDSDAGDTITSVYTIENTGGASAYDVVVTVPSIVGLTGQSITSVTDGGLNNLAYTGSIATGISLTNPIAANQTVLVTVTNDIDTSVSPNDLLTETASVVWSSGSGQTSFPVLSDDLTIEVPKPTITTTVESITPGPNSPNLAAGDVVTFRNVITLPEGTTDGLSFDQVLPSGLEYQSMSVDTTGFNGTVDTTPTDGTSGAVSSGQTVSISFDSPSNTQVTNDNNAANNSFAVLVTAHVTDSSALSAKSALQNISTSGRLDYTGRSGGRPQDSANNNFSEHDLSISASMSPNTGLSEGDTVTVTLVVTNNGTAPAYDVVVTDTLNSDLFDIASFGLGTTPGNFSNSYAQPTVTYTMTSGSIAPAGSVTFTYTANVKTDVVTGSSYQNNATVTGDSQDGSVTGERSQNDTDNAQGTVSGFSVSEFAIINSTEAWSSKAAIGETLTYRLTINVAEGLSRESTIEDLITIDLPTGFLYRSGTAEMSAVYDSSLTAANFPALATSTNLITPTLQGNDLEFDLGNINNSDDDANQEQLILTFDVLVENVAGNNRHDNKTATASINYSNFVGTDASVTDNEAIRIEESNLRITKTAAPSTVTGNQNVTFTVALTNSSASSAGYAWDWQLEDVMPVRLNNVSFVSATLSRGSVDLSACHSIVSNTITLESNCGSLSATERYLAVGETVTLVYSATVDETIGFEETITNRATVDVSSLPGLQGTSNTAPGTSGAVNGERNSDGSVNDLTAYAEATVTANKPNILMNADDNVLPVKGTTNITATIAIPVGTTDNFTFTYTLPSGLTYTGAALQIDTPATNFSSSLSPDVNGYNAGDSTLTLQFGTISNSAATAQNISVTVPVEVANILANQQGTVLTTNTNVSYQNVTTNPAGTIDITVIEPNITLVKSVTAGAVNSDAGDTISYRLVVNNTSSQATAFGVTLNDVLDQELLGASGNNFFNVSITGDAVLTGTSTALTSSNSAITQTAALNDTLSWAQFDLPPSGQMQIDYSVIVSNAALVGQTLQNNTSLDYNSIAALTGRDASNSRDDDNGDLNNYGETAQSSITLNSALALQATLTTSQLDDKFTIGEQVSYDLRVDIVEGVTENVVVDFLLATGLEYVSSQLIAESHIASENALSAVETSTNDYQFDLGNVTNLSDSDNTNDYFVIRIVAKVLDVPSNTSGQNLISNADVQALNLTSVPQQNVSIEIIEPNLAVTITPNKTDVTLEDEVIVTFDIAHSPTSQSDAFDVVFEVQLPSGVSYVTNSHVGQGALSELPANILSIDLSTLTKVEASKSFDITLTVNADAEINAQQQLQLINTAYSTLSGVNSDERTYQLTGQTSIRSTGTSFIDVSHGVSVVTDNGQLGVVDAGDVLEYQIIIENLGDAVSNAIYRESTPLYTNYQTSSLRSDRGSVDDSVSSNLTVGIGALANGETTVVKYRVVIANGVADGTEIIAQGFVDSELTIPELSDTDGIDENGDQETIILVDGGDISNGLYVQQSLEWLTDQDTNGAISPTDTMLVTYLIRNLTGSELTNVTVNEQIPSGLTYTNATAQVSGGNLIDVNNERVSVTINTLAPGEVVSAQYEIVIDNPLINLNQSPEVELFTLQAVADSDQTDPVSADGNGDPSDGYQTLEFTAVVGTGATPDVRLYLTWSLVNDINGNGIVNPGDDVAYKFYVVNQGAVTAENLILNDIVPTNTTYILGSSYTSLGLVSAENPLSVNMGNLVPGGIANVGFTVTINNDVLGGTVISNQGYVNGDNFAQEPSDDNGDERDGKNPTLLVVQTENDTLVPSLTVAIVDSSNSETLGSDFVQSEQLTLEATYIFPSGRFENSVLSLQLPNQIAFDATSFKLKRIFDTALVTTENPANINNMATNQYLDVSNEVIVNLQSAELELGTVINSDADTNQEQLVLQFNVNTSQLIPMQASTGYQFISRLNYLNEMSQHIDINALADSQLLNRVPTAEDDSYTFSEDSKSQILNVLTNDGDVDVGQNLTITNITPPNHGGSALIENNLISYTPKADYFGNETFTYTIVDPAGGSASANVTITLTPVVDAPVAIADNYEVLEGGRLQIKVDKGLLNNDYDVDGDAISVEQLTEPRFGRITLTPNGDFTYLHNGDESRKDTFTYRVHDGALYSSEAIVTINIIPMNDPPVARPDYTQTQEDTAVTISPLGNDFDGDGDRLTVSSANASNGVITINNDGTIVYTPNDNFNGQDIIDYCISDGHGGSDCSTITLDVTPVKDGVDAIDDVVTANIGETISILPLANDLKGDSDTIFITNASAAGGTVSFDKNGITYTSNDNNADSDVINYCISDGEGSTDCAQIYVTLIAKNNPPIAVDDVLTVDEWTTMLLSPLGNDSDPDGDKIKVISASASSGSVSIESGQISFVPNDLSIESVVITYQIEDEHGETATANIYISLNQTENRPPVGVLDELNIANWQPVTISVVTNDYDPDGDEFELISANASIGQVVINGGQITYTPVDGYVGQVVITYALKDEHGLIGYGEAIITIAADTSDLPTITLPEDRCGDLTVLGNALYTQVDLGTATAVDNLGNPLPVSLINNSALFPPGVNSAFWQATDAEGNTAIAEQKVCVKPLISLEKEQVVLEGNDATIGVYLNGVSDIYPLIVEYQVTSSSNDDHDLVSGTLVIEEGTSGIIPLKVFADEIPDHGETITVTLVDTLNRGAKYQHVITISEQNIAPKVSLSVLQNGQSGLTVSQNDGLVTVLANAEDDNISDDVTLTWSTPHSTLVNLSELNSRFTFDPSTLSEGVYEFNVSATDSSDAPLSDSETVYVHISNSLQDLTSSDTDGDLIPDNSEGYQDKDRDGIPDFLDRIDECNVLHQETRIQDGYFVEGDPGVCLRRGRATFFGETGGAHITHNDVTAHKVLPEDNEAVNIGGIMDFIAYDLPEQEQDYRVVIAIKNPVPANAVYRKYTQEAGWVDFVENEFNKVYSTRGEPGYCPPPGSELWQPGLSEGDWCVQLVMIDGGANDEDLAENGVISNCGFVGVKQTTNLPPVAIDDVATVGFNQNVIIDVLANDSDPENGGLNILNATATFGEASIEENKLVYQAPVGFTGQVKVTYGITDEQGLTDSAVVTITIEGSAPPIAQADTAEIFVGETVTLDLLENDSDPEQQALTVVEIESSSQPVSLSEGRFLTYQSDNVFVGTVNATYILADTDGNRVTGLVTITVKPQIVLKGENRSSGTIAIWALFALILMRCMNAARRKA